MNIIPTVRLLSGIIIWQKFSFRYFFRTGAVGIGAVFIVRATGEQCENKRYYTCDNRNAVSEAYRADV